ncbi:MAG: YncE family protein [Alphaproteobacteria bacterium]|nr:MAG: YncE family protein [Alphaproteobacteria bacterium]
MSHRSRPHRAEPVLSALVAAVTFLAWAAGVSFAVPAAAHDAVSTYLFVPNRDSADVAVIDTRTDTLVARVPVGRVPHQVVVSTRTDRLVASNTADNTITIVDLHALRPVATLALDTEPEHMELSPDGTLLAVGNIGAGTVSLVALPEGRERARVSGLIEPHNLTFSRDGTRLFVANLGGDHVSVIDVAAGRVVEEIRWPRRPRWRLPRRQAMPNIRASST